MADDKKKFSIANDEFDDIDATTKNVVITDSEFDDIDDSPKSPAPSMKGGESGALVRPLTPTSASEGSESESWTQTVNPFADKGAVKPTQQAGAAQAPKAKLLKVIPSSEKKSPELLKARVDTYGDMYKRAMDRAYTLKQSVEGVDNELKNSKAYVDSNPNDQNAINSYNALISKRNEMAEMARMEIARADAWQKGIEKTQLEIDESLTASESISNSISNMATQIKGFLPASGLAISTLQNKMMQGVMYVSGKLMGYDDETASRVSTDFSQNLPGAGMFGTTQKEARQFYTERLGELEKEQKPTKSIIKTFEEGDVAGLGAAILDGGSSVISSVITSAPTGGVGIFTEMMGRSVYDFNNEKAKRLKISVDELYDRGLDEAAVPLTIGAVSASLEKIGLNGISKAINKKIGSKALKDVFEIILEGSKEAGTEWLQTGAEEYNKALASGMNAEQAGEAALSKMLSEEGREAALKGAAGSGVSIATGRAAKSLYGMAKSNRDKLYQDLAKVETLARERANPNLSSEALASIDREINNTTANMQKEVLDQLNRRANLTEENASLVEGIEANVKTISDDIESKKLLSEDPSLSDDAKIIIDLEIADLEAKRLDLSAQSEEIIKNNRPVELKKNTSPTSDKYGTINRNDGKGIVDLTKEEYEAEQAKMQGKVDEQVTPTAEGEQAPKTKEEIDAEIERLNKEKEKEIDKETPVKNENITVDFGGGVSVKYQVITYKDGSVKISTSGEKAKRYSELSNEAFKDYAKIDFEPDAKSIIKTEVIKDDYTDKQSQEIKAAKEKTINAKYNTQIAELEKQYEKEPTKKEDGEPMSGGVQGVRPEGQAGKESAELRAEEEEEVSETTKALEAKVAEGLRFNANFNLPLEQTATPKLVSEAYHKAKADGSNPELVEAVEQLLGKPKEETPQAGSVGVGGDVETYFNENTRSTQDSKYNPDLSGEGEMALREQENRLLELGADRIQAHGLAKGSIGQQFKDLINILTKGLDSRGGGQLYTAPLVMPTELRAGAGSALGTGGGTAYTDGGFIILAREGVNEIRSIDDIGGVLVNQAVADSLPELVDRLKKQFPNISIESYSNAPKVIESIKSKAVEQSLKETPQEELLTPKQEEDAKKQQSGQMREQGVQDQPQRKGDSDMPIINEAELQDGEAVEEEVTQEELNKQQDKETQVLLNGEAAKRRSAGKFIKDGVEYVRNKVDKGIRGIKGSVKFAEGVPNMPFTYKLVEAETLQPSHSQGVRNQMHFIPEAQPKRRNDEGSVAAEIGFANNPRFNELGENTNAYSGAPVVNERNEVVQGNNRSAGLKIGYDRGNKKYKNDLADNAEKFGFTREQVEGMKNPVLVREVAFSDEGAIEYGNYDAKDLETGGKRRIDPLALVKRIPLKEKARLAKLLFSGEGTLNSNIRANSKDVLAILNPFLNQAQRTTLLKDGEITSSGVEDIEALVQQFLFDNGDMALPELFENLPYRQREGIRKSLPFIFSAGVEADVIPEIQNAILALNQFQSTGIENFDTWLNQSDVFADNKTPRDIYTPQELAIARALNEAKTQSEIVDKFKSFSSAVQGTPETPANLIDEAKPAIEGQSKEEALKQIFNVKENESRQKENLRGGKKVDKQQEAPKQKPKEPTAEEVEEEGLPKLTKEQQIEAERRSLNEPKNVSDLAKIFNKILGLSPKESVMAARLFDVKAKNMSELLGITKDEYYQRYWFTGEQEGGLSQMTLPDGRKVTVKSVSAEVVNGFYSNTENALGQVKQEKMSGNQWATQLLSRGANKEEMQWTGLEAFLKENAAKSISKADIQQFLKDNRIQVVEVERIDEDKTYLKINNVDEALSAIKDGYYITTSDGFTLNQNDLYDEKLSYPLMAYNNKLSAKFGNRPDLQLEGEKENYKEVLVTMPRKLSKEEKRFEELRAKDKLTAEESTEFAELVNDDVGTKYGSTKDQFKSTHFDEPNILVHLRMNTRTDVEGNKVLFLEEVQSDWGQTGKREGFTDTNFTEQDSKRIKELNNKFDTEGLSQQEMTELTNLKRKEKGISLTPTAPFVTDTNAWTKLGLKVALKEAVKQGADKIAWTTGEQQNERYDLSKQVDEIIYTDNGNDSFDVYAIKNGETVSQNYNKTINEIEGIVGKDIANKILSKEGDNVQGTTNKSLKGKNLQVGGKGMKGFYGSPTEGSLGIVGNVAKSLFKQEPKTVDINSYEKVDGRVENIGNIIQDPSTNEWVFFDLRDSTDAKNVRFKNKEDAIAHYDNLKKAGKVKNTTQHSIDITPELKAEAEQGQPLFQDRRGAWSKIAASAKRIISMYDKARLDTAVHEILGHDFLDEIISLSATNKEFEQDLNTIIDEYIKSSGNKTSKATLLNELKNFNVESNNQSVNARAIHEWFSRTAEGYFMGETNIKPDSKLAKMFEQFRQYLTDLFNTMTSRNYIIPSEPMKQIFRKAFGAENFDFVNDYAEANIMEGKLDVLRITENEIPQSRLDKFKKLREAKRGLGQEEDVDIDELVDAARYLSTDPTVNVFSVVDELVSMYPQKEEYIRKHSKTFEKVFVAEGKKVRETARSVYESEVVSPEMKQRAATIEDLFSYTPEKLQEKMEDVESLIADYSIDDLMAFFATNNEIPFKEYPLFLAAMQKRISRAINELNNSNQGQSAAKQKLLNYEMTIMDRYIAEGTATGQRLNYFKVLKNMSTDGKLRFFKRKFKEESGNAVKEFQDLISNLRKERDKAYKDNDYFLEENLSLEQRIEDLEAELTKERSTKAKNDKRKDRESSSSNYKNPPKRKISQSELNEILKNLSSAGLGQSFEDLNDALKLGFYIIQDKKKTIEQFTRDWNKITKQNKTQEELSEVYRDVRKYATENEGVDIDDFDSDAMIQSSIDSFNERASQKKNLAKKELDSDIAKAEKEAKDKDDAPSQLAKAILSNAKKELGLGKKQQDYVKELLGYLKNKAKDYYKTTNKQALVDPFEQLKYAVEMLNDANGRKIWDDSKAELIAKIDSDKDLSQQEKDDLKAYLDDYQNAIFDQLLSKNKLFNNVKKVLAEESTFVKKDGSVDWNGIIIQAKGNVEIAKQIILDSVADKLQGYSGSQVNSVIDAIGREYQRRINEKRADIIEKQLKDISDKKVIFKKKIATGFVQKLVEMENSGALGDQRFEQALKEWIGFSDMTPDKWSRLRELIVDAEEAPEGNERDRAIENLSAYIKFNKIGKFAEIYASAYYAGLLARPTTIIKNSTGIIEPLLTLFYKSFTDRNYAKAMLQGLKRGDAADIWGGGLVQGGKLDEEVGNDGLPRVNMLKQWKMQEKGIIPKLFALGAKPLDLLSMADALSQAMVERGAEYEFYARYLLEKNKEDIRNGVQGVVPITEKEARKIAIKRLSDDAMLDWAFAQAEDEFASRKIVPSSARLNRRAYEIVSESLLPTSVRELAQNLALEESYKSKLISFRGMTSQTRAQKRLETNYGVATFIGSFAKGLVDLLAEGGGYVAGGATKVLPVTEARRNQIRNSVERAISMRVLPFARGISNVVEKSLEKTPYGIVSGVIGATAEKLSYGKPKTIDEILQHQYMMNRNKAKIAKSATSMIIGSAIYYTLLSASKEWDDEEEKEERYYLPTGFYSAGETVRFGKNKIERYTLPVNCVVLYGRIIPLSLFGTVGIGSMITAQAYDNFLSKEKKKQGAVVDPDNPESIKGFSSFVSSSGNAILNMSAMQSISELQESVSSKGTMDFGDYASKLSVKSIALPIPFSGTANQIIQGARYLSGDKTAQAAIGADEKIYKELGLAGIVYNRPVLDWRGRPVNAVLQNQEGIASFVSMLDKRPLDKIDMYLLKELEFNPVIDKRLSENFADLNMVGMSKDEYYDYTKNVGMTVNNYIEAYFDTIKNYQIPQYKIDELAAEGKNETDLKKQLKTIKKTFVSDFLNIAEQEHMLNYQFSKGIINGASYEAKFKANNDRLENLIEKINDKGE